MMARAGGGGGEGRGGETASRGDAPRGSTRPAGARQRGAGTGAPPRKQHTPTRPSPRHHSIAAIIISFRPPLGCAPLPVSDSPLTHPTLLRLADSLARRPGVLAEVDGDPPRAAVAITLRLSDQGDPEILLIRRAEREGDPWSGQIALPGGRWSPNDESLTHTAFRETWEETGIDLSASGILLGTLDELRPRTPTLPQIIVSPVVAALSAADTNLVLSDEVAEAFWVSIRVLGHPDVSREAEVRARGATWRVPSFVIGERVVWGLTERILRQLLVLAE